MYGKYRSSTRDWPRGGGGPSRPRLTPTINLSHGTNTTSGLELGNMTFQCLKCYFGINFGKYKLNLTPIINLSHCTNTTPLLEFENIDMKFWQILIVSLLIKDKHSKIWQLKVTLGCDPIGHLPIYPHPFSVSIRVLRFSDRMALAWAFMMIWP